MKAVEKHFPVTQFTVSNKFQFFEYAEEILKCDYSVGTCVSVELFFFFVRCTRRLCGIEILKYMSDRYNGGFQ